MKKMFKLFMVSMLILGLSLAAMGCGTKDTATTDDDAAGKEEVQTLKVGTDAAYAPFEYQEDGKFTGFDIELLEAIAAEEGFKVEFTNMEFGGLISGLQSKSIDILVSAMTITEDRAKEVTFSDSYFTVEGQAVVVRNGETVSKVEDLVGKKIGVQANTTGHIIAKDIEGMKESDVMPFSTAPEALLSLVNKSVDAAMIDAPVVQKWIENNPEAKVTVVESIAFPEENYGIAVKKDNTELINKINSGLKKVKDNGKYDELYKKYFNK